MFGFNKKKTAALTINFYDNAFNTLDPTEISIVYTGAIDDMAVLSCYFIEYYHQVSLYLKGISSINTANALWKIIKKGYEEGFSKEKDLLDNDFYKAVLVPERESPTKVAKGTFYQDNTARASFTWGGENFYPPVSAIVFLQYIISVSTYENISILNDTIKKIVT